jgi:hypothetical protein
MGCDQSPRPVIERQCQQVLDQCQDLFAGQARQGMLGEMGVVPAKDPPGGKKQLLAALVHFLSCERNDPGPIPLCDDPCPADGMRAPGLEHPVQHRDADDRLGLLSVETACS